MRKHARELPEHAREHARELLDRDKRKDELDLSFEVGTPCTVSQFRFGGGALCTHVRKSPVS